MIKNKLLILGMYVLALTACNPLTASGEKVGIGNTILFILMSVVLTAVVYGLGILLGIIPLIGVFLKIVTRIGIILWWVILIIGCVTNYGWAAIPIALILMIIILGFCGGPGGFIVIFFG